MKRIVLMMCAGMMLMTSLVAEANANLPQTERREARESRRAERQEARMKADQKRMDRENYKQMKKMDRESRKANKRNYDNNDLGNVFGL
jgi:hypothetical protein